MKLLSVDPGNEVSAFVILDGEKILEADIVPNEELLEIINMNGDLTNHMAIEMIASYGLAVGVTVFETVLWIGRFMQAYGFDESTKVYRKDVKMHFCNSMRAKDGNIRQALIDRFGPVGTKKAPGHLYGLSKDKWSAMAIGIYWTDTKLNSSLLATR